MLQIDLHCSKMNVHCIPPQLSSSEPSEQSISPLQCRYWLRHSQLPQVNFSMSSQVQSMKRRHEFDLQKKRIARLISSCQINIKANLLSLTGRNLPVGVNNQLLGNNENQYFKLYHILSDASGFSHFA